MKSSQKKPEYLITAKSLCSDIHKKNIYCTQTFNTDDLLLSWLDKFTRCRVSKDAPGQLHKIVSRLDLIVLKLIRLQKAMSDIKILTCRDEIEKKYITYKKTKDDINELIHEFFDGDEHLFIQRELKHLVTSLDYDADKIKAPMLILGDLLDDMGKHYIKHINTSSPELNRLKNNVDILEKETSKIPHRRGGGIIIM